MRRFLCLALLGSAPLFAQVRTTELRAVVTIEESIATTTLTLDVANDSARIAEADWVLPLPPGAVTDGFVMTSAGKTLESQILAAHDARAVYERIVRARRDPGLLEYAGRDCLRARIFPIPARGSMTVEVRFRQVLPTVDQLYEWRLPLRAAGAAGTRPERCTVDLRLSSKHALRSVFTSTAGLHIVRRGENAARASFEGPTAQLGQEADVQLWFGLAQAAFGVDVLSFKRAGEPGYFLMLVAPDLVQSADKAPSPRTMTFVVDTSGSMAGEKIEQARKALRFFVQSLRPVDHFDVVPFSTEAMPFFGSPTIASAESTASAMQRIDALAPSGGTNIEDALARGVATAAAPGSLPITIFLTDGRPTMGARSAKELCATARSKAAGATRIFVFGVGDDVHTGLLDSLAEENGGVRHYVRPHQDIEVVTSDLLRKIQSPVLTSIAVEVEGARVTRTVPSRLPDLFRGSRLAIVGRYEAGGTHAVRLRGMVEGEVREFHYERSFAVESTDRDFIPALWAERRVGTLLDTLRLHGNEKELVDEVTALGRKFRIVTPYTSHLILEEGLRIGQVTPGGGGGSAGAPRSPGPGGPTTPGSGAPSAGGPSTGGPTTGGGAPSTPGVRQNADDLVARLVRAGAIPADATAAEKKRIVARVGRDLRRANDRLQGLSQRSTGRDAVDDSAYLADLAGQGVLSGADDFYMGGGRRVAPLSALTALLSRRIGDRVFFLRDGVWTDRKLFEQTDPPRPEKQFEAYSAAYFEALRQHPQLASTLAFSDCMRLLVDGVEWSIVPPKDVRSANGLVEADPKKPTRQRD